MTTNCRADPAVSRGAAQRLLSRAFAAAGIESAALDARLILCAALGVDHTISCASRIAPSGPRRRSSPYWQRGERARTGFAHSRPSRISRARFRPWPGGARPAADTESSLDTVLAALRPRSDSPLRLLDLGVGSGAILAALLSEIAHVRLWHRCRPFRRRLADRPERSSRGWRWRAGATSSAVIGQLRSAAPSTQSSPNPPYIARRRD